jgi:hypothetical protein
MTGRYVLHHTAAELDEAIEKVNGNYADVSKVTASAGDVLSGKQIVTAGKTVVAGTIPSLAAATYTPGTADQTIASGQYLAGAQTILGDGNLKAENIKEGVTIFGILGTAAGGETESDVNGNEVDY